MKTIKKGLKNLFHNNTYKDGNYKVTMDGDSILIKRAKGKLNIVFVGDLFKNNQEENIVKNVFNYIVTLLENKEIVLKVSGTNVIYVSKDLFSLQGSIVLENVKLHNPVLYNVELLNVDLSKSREILIGFCTIKNSTALNTMALKIVYANLTSQQSFEKLIKKLELSGN